MWQITFSGTKDACGILVDSLENSAESLSCFEKNELNHIWQVEAYYPSKPDLLTLEKEYPALKDLLTQASVTELPEKDWLKENRESFEPLDIGPFFIYDGHTTPNIPSGKIVFEINASTAFGTGRHATTKGCLEALNFLKKNNYFFSRPLDLGCGTGILALAISRLFDVHVCAVDNDPEAVYMTKKNAKKNGLEGCVISAVSEGFSDSFFLNHTNFDLITANILAQPLIDLAPYITQFTQPGGVIVLSGFYEAQKNDLLQVYSCSFSELQSQTEDEWVTLVMKRE